jgi:tRNA pseudouridine55 synthase
MAAKFNGVDKIYEFDLVLGAATDTDDDQGQMVKAADVPKDALLRLKEILPQFTGEIFQVPPAYSAIKVGGVPLYKAARRNKTIQAKARAIRVYGLDFVKEVQDQSSLEKVRLRLHCSSGTYVRAICRDIGERIGCFGHAAQIRRLASGPFNISDSVILSEFRDLTEEKRRKLINPLELAWKKAVDHL